MYLVFDTETTGIPRSYQAPHTDIENWPRVVQLGWETYDLDGRSTGAQCHLIRPVGFRIPADAEKVHHISSELATRLGIPIADALEAFAVAVAKASVVVSHNLKSFDLPIVRAEFYRLGRPETLQNKLLICTMECSTNYCGLPGRRGYKWPTLQELHLKLFRKAAAETHDAANDVAICSKCFFELLRLGVVRVPQPPRPPLAPARDIPPTPTAQA